MTPGKDLWQIIEGIEQGEIKALYLLGCEPLAFPQGDRIRRALEKLGVPPGAGDLPDRAAGLADVVFPAAAAAEKTGTFTTIDNRTQSLGQAVEPPGEARQDWDILAELHNRLAGTGTVRSAEEVTCEIERLVPLYAGQKKAAYTMRAAYAFAPATGAGSPSREAENRLLVGPILFHSGTTTTWSENNLTVAPEPYVEISIEDATKFGIGTGAEVKVTSALGSVTGSARLSNRLQPGLLFAPCHFGKFNTLLEGNSNLAGVKVEKSSPAECSLMEPQLQKPGLFFLFRRPSAHAEDTLLDAMHDRIAQQLVFVNNAAPLRNRITVQFIPFHEIQHISSPFFLRCRVERLQVMHWYTGDCSTVVLQGQPN